MKSLTTLRVIKQQHVLSGSQRILTIEDFKTKFYKELILLQYKWNILWLRILPDTSELSQRGVNTKNLLILTKR